jgi:N-acyl-D-amino-acid deacylase
MEFTTARWTALGCALFLALAPAAGAQRPDFDVLIVNGRVLDGAGNPWVRADIGIRGDRIVAVGPLRGRSAARVVDASGRYVAPGFIDLHSHADRELTGADPRGRQAHNLVMQGITTVVGGPDGRNPVWPISREMEAMRSPGVAVNFVPMVGHGTVRSAVMGDDYERPATPEEIERMRQLVRQGMEQGAWGLGAGPEYRPGRFSTTEEIVELARVVAPYDGFYYSHQRSQSPLPLWEVPSITRGPSFDGTEGMKETIRIGRESGIRVVGSHIKAKGRDMWGQSAIDVNLIDRARSEGIQVYLDQYPYETFGGGPEDVIPPWAFAPPGTDRSGGMDDPRWEERIQDPKGDLRRNLADPAIRRELIRDTEYMLEMQGGADRHVIVASPENPTLVGKTLAEVAQTQGRTPVEQLIEFALNAGEISPSGVLFRPFAASTGDVERYMVQEYTATSTDAGVSLQTRAGLHPRYFGAFPRKIAHYTRDRGIISLPFAIRAGTGLPAQIIGLPNRGLIKQGFKADVVIFDYDRIQDQATAEQPDRYPDGIEHVLVNGRFVVDGGRTTGTLPGEVLDRTRVRSVPAATSR